MKIVIFYIFLCEKSKKLFFKPTLKKTSDICKNKSFFFTFYFIFQTRLQYFALAIQGYIRKLDEFLKGKSRLDLKNEDVQLKLVAQRSAKNISAIIKDLFHSPPSYKTKVIVSWRPLDDKVKKEGKITIKT